MPSRHQVKTGFSDIENSLVKVMNKTVGRICYFHVEVFTTHPEIVGDNQNSALNRSGNPALETQVGAKVRILNTPHNY